MTAVKMKQSSLDLINQIDDKNTELLEKVWLFLTTNIKPDKPKGDDELTQWQEARMAKVKELAGAFSACQTVDWKQDKEEYLAEKYAQ